jgi:hypothetical protein
MAAERSYVSGNFFFELGTVKCGFVKSIDGGAISAEVINEPAGPSYFVKKHIGQPKYEEITMQIGFSMTKGIYEWIQQSWRMSYERKDGAITALDFTLTPKSTRRFTMALITETGIPACDGGSKEPAYMTLKFAPETIRYEKASGGKKDYGMYGKNEQKVWLPSNFQLQIDGLSCARVNKIDAFTVKQTTITDDIGEARDYMREPGKLEFPNLKITMAEVDAQSWIDWHHDFVIVGNNDETKEKGGSLMFLAPNQDKGKPLCTINFFNLGIFKIVPDKAEANADQIKRVTAELYCERMEFAYGANTIA